jgi:hypothetical protein
MTKRIKDPIIHQEEGDLIYRLFPTNRSTDYFPPTHTSSCITNQQWTFGFQKFIQTPKEHKILKKNQKYLSNLVEYYSLNIKYVFLVVP